MANLTRRDGTREEVQAGNGQELTQTGERYVTPRASVVDSHEAVLLQLEMPGVRREDLDITLERDELIVTGRRMREEYGRAEVLHQERTQNSFRRAFVLSERIDGSRISARLEDGVLHLTLPKTEDQKPKKIAIE